MNTELDILKGMSPGLVLERELRKRKLAKKVLAQTIGEYPQLLGDIIKGKRRFSLRIALKLEKELGKEEGYFMILQTYHDIAKTKKNESHGTPQLAKLRSVLFWDTDMHILDWNRQKKAIILRVFERGNLSEKKELIRFYGQKTVDDILQEGTPNVYRLHP